MFTKLLSNYTFSCVYFYVIVVDRVYHGHKTKKSDESKGHGDQINTSKIIINRHVFLFLSLFLFFHFCLFLFFCLQLIALSFSRMFLSFTFLSSLLSICATRGRWGMDCGNRSCKDHSSLLFYILHPPFCSNLFFYLQPIAFYFSNLFLSLTFLRSIRIQATSRKCAKQGSCCESGSCQ